MVEEIIKPPIRCHKCKEFDHTALSCPNAARCGRCTNLDHSDENCPSIKTGIFKCVNCNENHFPKPF